MPEFDTPHPIAADVRISVGDVRIVAGDRHDTVVDVRPGDASRRADVTAAEQTNIEFAAGRLLVQAPRKTWRSYNPFGGGGSVDVEIALPAGSEVSVEASVAAVHCAGLLAACRLKTAMGDIQVDQAAAVRLTTSAGDIALERAGGDAEISTGTGEVRVGTIDGNATIKNSNGSVRVGEVAGELRARSANGDITVEEAHESLTAKTANGDIQLGLVNQGSVVAETACGKVEIGIRDGTTAWLDLHTSFGNITNTLDASESPEPGEDRVEIRARTAFGDIAIERGYPPVRMAPTPRDQRGATISTAAR